MLRKGPTIAKLLGDDNQKASREKGGREINQDLCAHGRFMIHGCGSFSQHVIPLLCKARPMTSPFPDAAPYCT